MRAAAPQQHRCGVWLSGAHNLRWFVPLGHGIRTVLTPRVRALTAALTQAQQATLASLIATVLVRTRGLGTRRQAFDRHLSGEGLLASARSRRRSGWGRGGRGGRRARETGRPSSGRPAGSLLRSSRLQSQFLIVE